MIKINVGIVDDVSLFISGLTALLELDENISVGITASNGKDLFKKLELYDDNIDVLLLDLEMPEMDGVETLAKLNTDYKNIKIIILTSHYNDGMILRLLEEGASGFLAKNEDPDEVIETIKQVHQKGIHFNSHIMQLIRNRRLTAQKDNLKSDLTNREIDVLKLICLEYTNKQIAETLYISPRTVEGYRQNVMEKTNAKNTAGLVIYAIEHEIIEVNISKYK